MKSKLWNESILNELNNRKRKCQLKFGLPNEYVYPKIDPYFYPDVETFTRAHPFKENNKNCKFINTSISSKTDENGRYYENVRHKLQCIKNNGKWEPNAINRNNKYDRGVCWTNKEDAYCGTNHQYPSSMRPKDIKTGKVNIQKAKEICNLDPRCTHHRTSEFAYDCFAKKVKKIQISQPPLHMPDKNLVNYIEKWYSENKPSLAPETSELFGKGNRCKNENASLNNNEFSPNNALLYFEHIRKKIGLLNPKNIEDKKELERFMTESNLKKYTMGYKYINDHNLLSKYAPEYFNNTITNHIKSLMDTKIPSLNENHMMPKLSIPQSVVNMIMKNISNTKSNRRGMLAWHSTGSGKTCTATGVMDAFWDEKDRSIIFTSSIDAIASNPDYKFHECALNLYPRFKSDNLTRDNAMTKISEDFNERGVRFLSFAKLSNRINKTIEANKNNIKLHRDDIIDLNKSILIIDEVHNLFRPLATQRKQHEFLEQQLLNIKKYPGLKIVILTATPGDNIVDILKLLNMIRDIDKKIIIAPNPNNIIEINIFKENIRDMISFFDMSSDTTKFPIVEDIPAIRYPMSKNQFEKYIEAYKGIIPTSTNFNKLAKINQINKYWGAPRRYSNMMYNFDKDMNLSDFSSKLPGLLKNIATYDNHKQYVYSAFYQNRGYGGHGILAIAKELEKQGYTKLTVKEAKKFNSNNILPNPAKRYVLAITSEIGDNTSSSSGQNLHELIKIYNSPENKNGELIHVFLASQGFNEGIDLKAVRHIHIFEPLVTWASDKQTLGRAARYCSHQDLDRNKNEWKVTIHRYISDFPINITKTIIPIDQLEIKVNMLKNHIITLEASLEKSNKKTIIKQEIIKTKHNIRQIQIKLKDDISGIDNIEDKIFEESRTRMKSLLVIYQAMKDAAVDCKLLNKFHGTYINCL